MSLVVLESSDVARLKVMLDDYESGALLRAVPPEEPIVRSPIETYVGQTLSTFPASSGGFAELGFVAIYGSDDGGVMDWEARQIVQVWSLAPRIVHGGEWVHLTRDAYSGKYFVIPLSCCSADEITNSGSGSGNPAIPCTTCVTTPSSYCVVFPGVTGDGSDPFCPVCQAMVEGITMPHFGSCVWSYTAPRCGFDDVYSFQFSFIISGSVGNLHILVEDGLEIDIDHRQDIFYEADITGWNCTDDLELTLVSNVIGEFFFSPPCENYPSTVTLRTSCPPFGDCTCVAPLCLSITVSESSACACLATTATGTLTGGNGFWTGDLLTPNCNTTSFPVILECAGGQWVFGIGSAGGHLTLDSCSPFQLSLSDYGGSSLWNVLCGGDGFINIMIVEGDCASDGDCGSATLKDVNDQFAVTIEDGGTPQWFKIPTPNFPYSIRVTWVTGDHPDIKVYVSDDCNTLVDTISYGDSGGCFNETALSGAYVWLEVLSPTNNLSTTVINLELSTDPCA